MRIPEDIINHFSGIAPGSALDAQRSKREEAKKHAQQSFLELFAPENLGAVSLEERFALGTFAAALYGATDLSRFYEEGLKKTEAAPALRTAVAEAIADEANKGNGPYGAYPQGPLSAENASGPTFHAAEGLRESLGERLFAAFRHTHMLVFHPRDADAASLQTLLDAGWTEDAVVTLSQLVAFLAYQARLIHGLRVLADDKEFSASRS